MNLFSDYILFNYEGSVQETGALHITWGYSDLIVEILTGFKNATRR